MVLRLWAANPKESESGQDDNWTPRPGLLALVEDIVGSKNGVVLTAQDQIYVSGFQRPADALVVSRQVQIGVQGFRRGHPGVPLAVSIAIDAAAAKGTTTGVVSPAVRDADSAGASKPDASVEPPHELVSLLKISKPAQILLTHDLFQLIANSAGVPLKPFPSRFGVHEYLWTAEDQLDLLKSEPQLTLAVLPSASSAKPQAKEPSRPESKARTDAPVHAPLGRSTPQSWLDGTAGWSNLLRSPRVLVMAGVPLLVVIVLVIVGIYVARGPSRQTAKPSTPLSDQSRPPAPSNAPAVSAPLPSVASPSVTTPSSPVSPAPEPKVSRSKKGPRTANSAPAAAVVPAPPSDCQSDIAKMNELANQSFERKDYTDAERRYLKVLQCDSRNATATSGLERTRIAEKERPE